MDLFLFNGENGTEPDKYTVARERLLEVIARRRRNKLEQQQRARDAARKLNDSMDL